MRRFLTLSILFVVCPLPVWASDPGEPLDCSDWALSEPGLSCTSVQPFPCGGTSPPLTACQHLGGDGRTTVEGDGLYVRTIQLTSDDPCGCDNLVRWEIRRVSADGVDTLVLAAEDRCVGTEAQDKISDIDLSMNKVGGYLSVRMGLYGRTCGGSSAYSGYQRLRIEGFTTLFEIFQSYDPAAAQFTFRVPALPEGFPAADWFDTYAGLLTHPIDFQRARPIQCGFPASPPSAGDYLTVADTMPTPPPGRVYYYVTAVHQGETRYGRKSSGGILSGRDPAVLPGCSD